MASLSTGGNYNDNSNNNGEENDYEADSFDEDSEEEEGEEEVERALSETGTYVLDKEEEEKQKVVAMMMMIDDDCGDNHGDSPLVSDVEGSLWLLGRKSRAEQSRAKEQSCAQSRYKKAAQEARQRYREPTWNWFLKTNENEEKLVTVMSNSSNSNSSIEEKLVTVEKEI